MKKKTRGNGQGSAYKRGSSWTASVVIGWKLPDDPTKARIPIKRTKAGFKTKKDALAYCPVLLAGGWVKPKETPRLSYYWELYKENKLPKLGKSKQCCYTVAWNKLRPIHDMKMDHLTIELMQRAVSQAAKTYYPQKDCKTVLTKLFELAAIEGYVNKDLPSFIELVQLEETEQIPFSREEQQALWKQYESGNMDACIPLLMIYTGMMPGEAMKLKVDQIDLENRQITGIGLKTKVRKKTPVVLSGTIMPVIEDLISNARDNGFIWSQNETAWYKRYYDALAAAGCRRLTPYSCRHTTATALAIDKNIAPQTIRRVMRWSTVKMLDRYAHPDQTDAIKAVDALDK